MALDHARAHCRAPPAGPATPYAHVLVGAGRQGPPRPFQLHRHGVRTGDAEGARAQWRKIADGLRLKLPKLATCLNEAAADVLAYMTFRAQHRAKLHSTSPLERVNGEIKRRTEVPDTSPTRTPSLASSARSCSNRTTE